jgi:hypothetical protein
MFVNVEDLNTTQTKLLIRQGKARMITKGTSVDVQSFQDNWAEVKVYGQKFYVDKQFISCTPSASTLYQSIDTSSSAIDTSRIARIKSKLATDTEGHSVMEFLGLYALVAISILLIVVVVLWLILPFLVMGTNKRINLVNDNLHALDLNIIDSQKSLLEVQKDILACLEKISKGPDTDKDKHLPVKD